MKMEIIATFPIQLYISIYSTLRFNFSKAYHVLCRLFQHSVWGDQYSQSHQLHHVVQSELMGVSAFFFSFFFVFLGGTITDVQLWISVSDDVFLPSVLIFGWTAQFVRSVTTHLLLIPQRIYLSFYTTTCNQGEDPPYVKVRHDHLYTYSFTITVCLLWHAENDTVNMTYSSLRYVC